MATGADRPLVGVGVVVTRPDRGESGLSDRLRELGATVHAWPTIQPAPPVDDTPLMEALDRLDQFTWLVLTSPRAVSAVAERRISLPPVLQVAVVGRATAREAEGVGWRVDLVPAIQTAEALVAELGEAGVAEGDRVLFPASEIARDTLEAGLVALGCEVVRVTAYRTLPTDIDGEACLRAIESGEVQVISFASPSAVDHLRAALGDQAFAWAMDRVLAAAIGPTTLTALREAGATRWIEAPDHSLEGLARAIAEWASEHEPGVGS